ncbi:uncharacterized protein F4807DRAFT_422709 [Annulohypoxylon truncatum]|uniref:uncharacterized protein n=1 Tax=Annulohypoxylon truncatum TaxID=327061 RepID=UPI0020089818|nr:uncharacterized protein F4807DRAFT_422709 [Annulohypoxylon truncatum]KAI1210274.1 hypothetical protein F4807DRAFT_422709 [Annulohypoxylon truncatum]
MSAHQTGAGGFGSARPPIGMPVPGATAAPVESFTPEMRDRQARGKDPYESSEGSGGDWPSEGGKKYRKGGSRKEAFSTVERRRMASQVLDSPELLMMAAQRDNESIPATRLRYMRMLCGLEQFSKKPQRGGVPASRVASVSTPGRPSRKDTR